MPENIVILKDQDGRLRAVVVRDQYPAAVSDDDYGSSSAHLVIGSDGRFYRNGREIKIAEE